MKPNWFFGSAPRVWLAQRVSARGKPLVRRRYPQSRTPNRPGSNHNSLLLPRLVPTMSCPIQEVHKAGRLVVHGRPRWRTLRAVSGKQQFRTLLGLRRQYQQRLQRLSWYRCCRAFWPCRQTPTYDASCGRQRIGRQRVRLPMLV